MSNPTYLLVGATGKQGGAALSTLLRERPSSNNSSIRFITRNPSSPAASKLAQSGSTPVKADLSDKSSLISALQGVDRAFLVTDAMAGEEKEEIQGRTFVDAAKEAGVKHIVFTSVGGADIADTVPHFRSKYRVEQYLQSSGLSYTILRPVAFMDNFPPGPGLARFMTVGAFFAMAGHKPVWFVAVEDIGIVAAKALLNPDAPEFKNKIINLGAGKYDLNDTARAIEKGQGHSPWLARYFPTFVRSIIPHDFREMMKFFEYKGYPDFDVEALRKIHPGLLTLDQWFAKNDPAQK